MKQRWGRYLKDFASPPYDLLCPGETSEWKRSDPAEGYRQLAQNAGFNVLFCKVG